MMMSSNWIYIGEIIILKVVCNFYVFSHIVKYAY